MSTRNSKNPRTPKATKKDPKWIEALEARIAPAVTVINVDSLVFDADGDGLADPGDRIHYQVTVQNTGPGSIGGLTFQDIINDSNLTLVPGSINVSPLAIDDSFNAVGNTTLRVGGPAGTGPEVFVAGGSVTANDFEFLSDSFILSPITNGATALGGTVTLSPDGTFVYIGPTGATGVTDTFTYTIKDDGIDGIAGTPDDLSSTGTVSIALTGKVWYIDNTAPGGGNGTSALPFNSLASLSGATGPDAIGDTIYVASGSGNYAGGIALLNGQTLHGANDALTSVLPAGVPSGLVTLKTAGAAPVIANSIGNGVTLANGNTLKGLIVGDTVTDIAGTNFGTLTVTNVTLNGTGSALNLTTGTLNGTLNSISTATSAAFGIKLSAVSGSLTTSSSTFNGIANNGSAVEISNSGLDVNLGTFNVGAITGTTSHALLSTNHTGSFTTTGGSVTGVGGNDFEISGGTGAISVSSNITNTAGRSISIDNHDAGNVTFSGTISDSGTGLSITNSNGGTFTFSGATKTFNTGVNQAITLTNNNGGIINFTGGNLAITTTSGTAFNATGGGTISVQGSVNTINVDSGSGLIVANTTIANTNLNFERITVGTGAFTGGVGISLDTTGSNGGLVVTGNGTAGSGGTIRFKSGPDGSVTSGIGIYLNNTSNVSLSRMQLNNFDNFAIRGTNVSGFTLSNSVINGTNGTNDTIDEASVAFNELTGSASITNSTIAGGVEDLFRVINTAGTLNRITFDTVTFSSMNAATGNDALFIQGKNTSTVNVTVQNSSFTSARGDHFQFDLTNNASGNLIFNNNQLSDNITPVTGGGGITLSGGGSATANTSLTYSITNSTFRDSRGDAILVALQTGNGSASGTIDGNTIGIAGINGSGSSEANAIEVRTVGRGANTVTINNNQIHQYSNFGVYLNFGDTSVNGTSGTVGAQNLTVTNNLIDTPSSFAFTKNAVQVNLGTVTGDNYVATVDIKNNNGSTGGSTDVSTGSDYVLRQRMLTTMKLPGYTGANNDNAAVAAFIQGQNIGTETVLALNSVATGGGGFTNSPLLFMPATPEAPSNSQLPSTTTPEGPGTNEQPPISGEKPVEDQTVGQPSGTDPLVVTSSSTFTQAELDAIVDAAIQRWEATGISADQKALLRSMTFSIADLPGWYLGQTVDGKVTLDRDAAGNGWFVDSTPLDDSEFTNVSGVLSANANSGAGGRLDVLTTVMHEFGHALGLDDTYAGADSGNLMYGYLHLGERRVAAANQADGAVPHEHAGKDFLFAPVSLGSAQLPAGKTITIVYDQTVNSTINASQATSQIRLDYTGAPAGGVLSDDPSIAGTANPTVTQLDRPDVTVAIGAPSSVLENSGNTFTYTFTRQGPTTDAWTANFNVTGSATSGDYSIGTQSGVTFDAGTGVGAVTFAAGQSTATVVVTVTGDNVVEANETVIVNVASGTNYDVDASASASGTITNDDTATISISGGSVSEGDSGTANLPFTITLSNPVDVDTTVQFSAANGTAIAPGDYTGESAITVTIPAGQTSVVHNVVVNGDSVVELNETLTGSIGTLSASGRGVTLGTSSALGTINNDDNATISISGGSITEGNSGTANLPFTVTLSKAVDVDTTVQFSTADLTALAGGDYVAQSGITLTIPAGSLSATRNVAINGDTTVELNETFTGSINNLSAGGRNVSLGTTSATATINNDDNATISISGGLIAEGNSGTANLPFTVTLSQAVDVDTVVQFSTADITALAGSDYVAQSGVTVTIPAGQLSVTQNVTVSGDNTVELNETLTGSIGGLSAGGRNVTLGTASATGTINNDDSATVSIVAGTVTEGNSGTTNLPFTVILSNPVDVDTTVQFVTEGGTATSGSDFVSQAVLITIPAGQTSATRNVTINGDTTVELDETVGGDVGNLNSGGRSVTFGTSAATGTIFNDDTATVSITGGTVAEGNSGTANLPFTITLSNPVDVDTTVQFSTANGSALAPGDYASQSLVTVTIPAGQTSVTRNVAVNGDNTVELDETIFGNIGGLGASGRSVTLGTATATGTISNDDTATVSITGSSISEGNSGTSNLPFTITLSNPVDVDTTVQFSTADGTAIVPGDYTAQSLITVTIPAGQTTVTQNVAVNGDGDVETDETLTGSLSGVSSSGRNVTLGTNSATGTITNDDSQVTLAVTPGSVLEDGTQLLVYTFTRTGFLGAPLTVGFSAAGTATFNTDFTLSGADTFNGTTGAITFAANSSTASITVDPVTDTNGELDETVALSLVPGAGYSVGAANTATGTIVDDDTKVSIAVAPGTIGENSGLGMAYTFTRTGDTTLPLTVNFSYGGSATFGSDYNQTGAATFTGGLGTVVIPAGMSSVQVTLGILNDQLVEGDETALLTVTTGSGYGVANQASATGTIDDNDTAIVRFVGASSTIGEEAGTHNIGVELLITADGVVGSGTLANPISVNVNRLGTSTASDEGVDYSPSSPLTLTFGSNAVSSTQNATISIVNDTRVEGDEVIDLNLGTLVDSTGQVTLGTTTTHTATIHDNDTATISLASPESNVGEGAGTHNVGVTLVITANGVTGTGTLERNITVNLQDLLTGSATSNEGGDYSLSTITTLTFASGESGSTKNATLTLANDTRVEGSETVNLQLNNLNDGTGGQVSLAGLPAHTVTISDNDTATISLVTGNTMVGEGATSQNIDVVLTITANGVVGSGTLDRDVTVNLEDLLTGTATGGGSDYNLAPLSTLTFASGEAGSTKTVSIGLVNDTRVEGGETINLGLNGINDGTGGQVNLDGSPAHSVTIVDNDFATISFGAPVGFVNENIGSQNVSVILTITANGTPGTGTLDRAVSVNVADLLNGNTTTGADYTFTSPQTVTFGVGAESTTQNATLSITDDTRVEGTESLGLQLNSLTDGSNGQVTLGNLTTQQLAIADNDTATISFTAGSSTAGELGGNHNVGVTLVITGNGVAGTGTLERDVTVTLTDLLTGTATAAGDYNLGTPQTITFTSGDSSSTKNVVVGVIDDNASEGNETINLQLGSLSDPTEGHVSLVQPTAHTITIVDNDVDLTVTKTESAALVTAGSGAGNLTYTITVTNAGLTNASGVVLSENLTLVPGVSIASITPSANGGTFELTATPDGVWTVGSLAAGDSATLVVVLTVGSATAAGIDIISDTATITATNENLVNIGNDSAAESTSVQRLVDLQLTKTDGLTNATPGSVLSYSLNVSNTQPSDANGVILTETLPAGTTFNAAASSAGWTEASPGVYTLSLGTVAGNSNSAPVTFAVTVNSHAPAGLDTITNTALLVDDGSLGGDSTPANNIATDINALDAAPDLKVTKTASTLTAVRGGLLTYTLTYSNVGNQDATGISIAEMVPANTTFVSGGSTPGWAETVPGSGTYHFDIADLGAGQTFSVTYQVKVNATLPAGTTGITNTVSIADDGHNGAEPTPNDNQSTATTLLYQGIYAFSLGLKDDVFSNGGTPPMVKVYDIATGQVVLDFLAYEKTSKAGVRIAVGDLNGDGFDDVITAYAKGTGRVRAFDGLTGEQMSIGGAMELAVRGKSPRGVFIASGDVTGDGRDDIIVSESQPGSRIKVYDGATGELAANFKPFGNKNGGVRVSVGDVNGDGIADIVAGSQKGGSGVRVFEGGNLTLTGTPDVLLKTKLGKAHGVFVSVADVTGDGINELIIGERTKAKVSVYSPSTESVLYSVSVFGGHSKYGVRVAAADVDLDGIAEIIANPGATGKGEVWFLDGADGSQIASRTVTPFPENIKGGIHAAGTFPISTVQI